MAAAKKPKAKKPVKRTTAPIKRTVSKSKTAPTNTIKAQLEQSNLRLTILAAVFCGLSIVFAVMTLKTYW